MKPHLLRNMATSSRSREDVFCEHCNDIVSHATYYRHQRLRRSTTDADSDSEQSDVQVCNLNHEHACTKVEALTINIIYISNHTMS